MKYPGVASHKNRVKKYLNHSITKLVKVISVTPKCPEQFRCEVRVDLVAYYELPTFCECIKAG